ncbi:MAG TPA: hypothetical protein VE396_16610 [Xanthobacteraceae bacterium]|nr:hypothetical protein [Xanthobacteraceae bacterium]
MNDTTYENVIGEVERQQRRHPSALLIAALIALFALLAVTLDWLRSPSPDPSACEIPAIDLPHSEITGANQRPRSDFVVTQVTSPNSFTIRCYGHPGHSTR